LGLILEVLSYPNKKLYEVSKDVKNFDEELHKLLDDMYDTMIAKEGIGLAAIQIGVAKRIFIINLANDEGVQDKENLIEIINPKFELREGECIYQEGCLSVPGYYEDVKRNEVVAIKYQDRFGKEQSLKADGLLAIAIQKKSALINVKNLIRNTKSKKKKKLHEVFKMCYLRRWTKDN